MVAFSQGARSQLLVKKQTNFGVLATGNYTKARFNTHSLDLQIATMEGQEIRADRQVADFRHGQQKAMGDMTVDLCYADHEPFIESAMFNLFGNSPSGTYAGIGTNPVYLTMEDGALDINQFRLYNSLMVDQWSVDIKPNQIVKSTFRFVGQTMTQNATTGGGTPVAAGTTAPFDSSNGAIYFDANSSGGEQLNVTGLTFQVANSADATQSIGLTIPQGLQYGRGRVTGTVTMYYSDAAQINQFINESTPGLLAILTNPQGNSYEFRFPKIKFNGAAVPVQNEQSRIITLPFVALYDSSFGNAFRVTQA